MDATDRPLMLFLGDDMVPEPSLVACHMAMHERHPETEAAVLGHVEWHPEVAGTRVNRWLDWSRTQFDYRSIRDQAGQDVGFGRFYSCNVSLKRDLFHKAGGFDPRFVFYYEDLDMGWRLHEQGLRLYYEPQALTLHHHRYDLAAARRRFEGIALGERVMAHLHAWFPPFFLGRVEAAMAAGRVMPWWPLLVDAVPGWAGGLRAMAEHRANRWYHTALGPSFLRSWERAAELTELMDYLGPRFDPHLLIHHVSKLDEEAHVAPDEVTFYRTSERYLYDLTVFAMSGTKEPYLRDLRRALPPGARVLDYGCGIGSDGLSLAASGYRVAFADFDNPSTRYLAWRLERRGIDAPVFDIEASSIPADFDAAFSFDVIEHVDDPFAFLATLESRARIVAVNLLEPDASDTHLHRPLPIGRILDHAARHKVLSYRRYHGRSHLVVYESRGAGGLRSRARMVQGRLLS